MIFLGVHANIYKPRLFIAFPPLFRTFRLVDTDSDIETMHISLLGATLSLLCASATAFTPASTSGTDKLNDHGMTKLKTYLHKHRGENTCSLETAVKRQEWYAQASQALDTH
jgi:hypothetical protein